MEGGGEGKSIPLCGKLEHSNEGVLSKPLPRKQVTVYSHFNLKIYSVFKVSECKSGSILLYKLKSTFCVPIVLFFVMKIPTI